MVRSIADNRMKCTCSTQGLKERNGYCPRFDKIMGQRYQQICRNECSPKPCPNREALLILWSQRANQITGLGDVVNLITRATGIKSLVKKRAAKTGKKCGCGDKTEGRHKTLNDVLPLGPKT